jgi:hypothetical protein
MAAWNYRDKAGPLLNVEVSEPYVHEEPANIFDTTRGRTRLKLLNQQRSERLTAFRLPGSLLQTVD